MEFPLVAFITLIASGSCSPGPNNIMLMTLAHRIGFRDTLRYIAGVIVGFFCLQITILLFSSVLLEYLPSLKNILKFLGTLYLLYMAVMILRSNQKIHENDALIPKEKLFITAFMFQFINPKAIIFGVTFISTFGFPYFSGLSLIIVPISAIIGTLCGAFLWSLGGILLTKIINEHKMIFNIVMASLLIYSAISILINT